MATLRTRQRCKGCGELMHITATEERCKFCTLALENKRLRALIATADAMYAEHAAVEQERSDAEYRAEFGPDHKGPHLAGPLGSKGREYVYERHRLSREYPDMPEAATALGQLSYRHVTTSAPPATAVTDSPQGQ